MTQEISPFQYIFLYQNLEISCSNFPFIHFFQTYSEDMVPSLPGS